MIATSVLLNGKGNVLRNTHIVIEGEKKGRFVNYSLRSGVLCDAVEAGIPKDTLDLGCCQLVMPGAC